MVMMRNTHHKKTFLWRLSVLAISMIPLSGCYDINDYSGDGRLIDNGKSAATDRYVLEFGVISIDKDGVTTYRISNLPKSNFVVGLNITYTGENPSKFESGFVSPLISLQLEDSEGNIVFSKESRLDTWTWSIPSNKNEAFVYGQGNPGTYFESSSKSRYILRFWVVDPVLGASDHSVELLAKSGGWK